MNSTTANTGAPPAALVCQALSATSNKTGKTKRAISAGISQVSFVVYSHEAVGIIGSPIDGTSVLLQTVAGMIAPENGNVYVRSQPALLDSGSVFKLDETLRANVERVAMTLELNGSKLRTAVSRILARVDLLDDSETLCGDLDALEVERARLAAILHAGPDLLLIDDPLAKGQAIIDEEGSDSVERHLRLGGALVLVGRDPQVMKRVCTRIIWLHEGEIIMDAPTDEVMRNYRRLNNLSKDKPRMAQMYRNYIRRYEGINIITQSAGNEV